MTSVRNMTTHLSSRRAAAAVLAAFLALAAHVPGETAPGVKEFDRSTAELAASLLLTKLQDDVLVLRGEKKSEQEEQGKNWFRREQSYGSFHRAVELPAGVDASKAKAQFKKGVLTFTAPKRPEEQARRKTVPIQAE